MPILSSFINVVLIRFQNKRSRGYICDQSMRQKLNLEEQCSHATLFALLLDKDLEILVDDSDSQQYTCARSDSTHEVSKDGQCPNTQSTKSRGCWDVSKN